MIRTTRLTNLLRTFAVSSSVVLIVSATGLFAEEKARPIFIEGEAQIVPEFKDPKEWIRHDLWVEAEFDSDGDGKKDRLHVDVTRPKQTDTEGLKLPVVYETSPYFAGTAPDAPEHMWDTKHPIGAKPPKHETPPKFERKGKRRSSPIPKHGNGFRAASSSFTRPRPEPDYRKVVQRSVEITNRSHRKQ